MNKILYPAVFQSEDVGYSVWIPDIQVCISQGDTLEEAYENIKDSLGLFVEEQKDTKSYVLPEASKPEYIKVEKGQFVALVEFDWVSYLKKTDNRAVNKTLTIPAWLNEAAKSENINFSQVLQKALKETLHLQ